MPANRLPEINGIALKAAREKRGMERVELATQCCLSSKMIAELEEGGNSSFYSLQLKVSAAKRVGSYLGLPIDTYLKEVTEPFNKVIATITDNSEAPQEDEEQAPVSTIQSVVNEGEQLDDLIYESTNSGTSLPNVGLRASRAKWINVSLFVLLGVVGIYGVDSWFHFYDRTIAFFSKDGNQKIELPEPPKEQVTQDQQQTKEDVLTTAKAEAKVEMATTSASASNPCPRVREDQLLVYKSPNPSKSGDAVNIKTLVKQSVCVIDSEGKQVIVDLEPNTAQSFRGSPPFVVVAQDLDNVEMFYQGWRVRPPSAGVKQMKLIEVALQ